ncbi:MAG: ATP-binding protein [Gammaproteobacteria bacterium]
MTSIRRALLWSLMPAVLALLAVAVFAVLHEVRDEIDELFDAQLVQAAHAIPASPHPATMTAPGADDDPQQELVLAVWERGAAAAAYYPDHAEKLPRSDEPGFSTLTLAGEEWRRYVLRLDGRLVQAAQPLRIRNEAGLEIASRVTVPLLLLIPVIVLTVLLLVKRGLRPLTLFARELDSRSPGSLGSLALTAMPAELLPMATAMNDLLSRLSTALDAQQVFVADAAHELLTPLTALQVQVQVLERAQSEDRRARAILDVRASLERCIGLARQLLTLARHSAEPPTGPPQRLLLSQVVRSAVSNVLPKAHARRIDLGVADEEDCVVSGDEKALQTLLGNLLDNAVKYSPVAGRVDVTIGAERNLPAITVSDSGPGIQQAERARVFDRFYRSKDVDVEGSGLGLAIAKEIAARHGARIELRTPGKLGGLDVQVVFPAASA